MTRQALSGRGWRELALVVAGYGILTVLLTAPLAFHLGSVGRIDNADTRLLIWNVAWVARTLVVDPLHVYDANIFYPHHWTLAYSESNLGAGILAIPVYWATGNPVAAYNFVALLSFVLSGVGTYYLVRYLVGDRRAAGIAGIAFAFCPYVFSHIPHIHLLMTGGLPLCMLAFHRAADRPTIGRGAVLGLAIAGEALLCGYYAVFAGLMVGFAVLTVAAVRRQWVDRPYWIAMSTAALVAGAAALPLFLPYFVLQQTNGYHRSPDDARFLSAGWRTYFASSAYAHRWLLPIIGRWTEVLFPGFVALGAGVAGVPVGWRAGGRRREIVVLYGGLAVLALWASLGPAAGLYSALHAGLPVFSLLRAPSRFGLLVVFALAVLGGVTVAEWLRRMGGSGSGGRRKAALTAAALAAATMLELKVPLTFSQVPPIETAYRVLATLPRGPVLELPVYSARFASERTSYMLSSTAHWMPLVGGYSSYIPPDYVEQSGVLADFPSEEAFELVADDHVRYVIVHLDRLSTEARHGLEKRLADYGRFLARRYADRSVWLYEVVGTPD